MHICIYISIYKIKKIDNTGQNVIASAAKQSTHRSCRNWEKLKMDQAFIEKMKKELLKQRKTILESLAGQSDDMRELVKTVESGDEADVAADAIDRTLLTALGSQDAKRLQQIDNCLDRIYQNKYGRCIKCGKDIPKGRLEAVPWALMCVNCASAEERKNR